MLQGFGGHFSLFYKHQYGKESDCSAGDPGLIPGSGRSPGEGNGYPLQYSCLENSMDRGARQATVHWVLKSQTWWTDWYFISFHFNSPWDLFLIAVWWKNIFPLVSIVYFFFLFFLLDSDKNHEHQNCRVILKNCILIFWKSLKCLKFHCPIQ